MPILPHLWRDKWLTRTNCRFFKAADNGWDWKYSTCLHPRAQDTKLNLVTGKTESANVHFCDLQRGSELLENRCGTSGRWFEPKEAA